MQKCLIVSLLENRRGLVFKPFCGPCIYTPGSLWNRLLDKGIASLSVASFRGRYRHVDATEKRQPAFLPLGNYLETVTFRVVC
jgi:hypothetical protein